MRFNLHLLIEPISELLAYIAYLSKFSKWRREHPSQLNDFYNKKFDQNKRYILYQFLLETEKLDQEIDYLEFGVAKGNSLKWWIEHNKNPKSRFIGFDVFTGLPEDWGILKKGAFSTKGKLPNIEDNRCTFIKGFFQDTLSDFLEEINLNRKTVIHSDSDLYSSTLYVLTNLASKLKKGDIIIFDEFAVPLHEFRAFIDFVNSYYLKYELLGAVNNYHQIAIKII